MIVLRDSGAFFGRSVVISRAVATDLYRGREMTRFFGLLMTINGLGANYFHQSFGSLLLEYISWKGVFVFLALIGVIVLIFSFRLKESLSVENRFTRFNIFHLFDFWCDYQKSLIYEPCRNSKFLARFHVCLYCGFAIYFPKFLWVECICL